MTLPTATEDATDDAVVAVHNPSGRGPVLLVCEHASNRIPPEFADLGLAGAALTAHIAWDPGALPVAERLAKKLDAPLVAARISRLVYDCNRPPHSPGAMPAVSEVWTIPGNAALSDAERADRVARFYTPFRDRLSAEIDGRIAAGQPPVMVTIHSFVPVFQGRRREVEIGVLHDSDSRLADALLAALAEEPRFVVRRNDPYGPEDGVTHTLIDQALPRGLANVMIEIRNDLIADAASQTAMADWLAERIADALRRMEAAHG